MKNKSEKRFILSDGMFFNESGKAEMPKMTYRKEVRTEPKSVERKVKSTERPMDEINPEYLSDESDFFGGYKIRGREGRELKKISLMEQAMNRIRRISVAAKIEFDFYTKSFIISKGSPYPQIRYLYVNADGEYAFGTESVDLVYDKRMSVVEKAIKEFLR